MRYETFILAIFDGLPNFVTTKPDKIHFDKHEKVLNFLSLPDDIKYGLVC